MAEGTSEIKVRVHPLMGLLTEHAAEFVEGDVAESRWMAEIPASALIFEGGYVLQLLATTE